MIARLLVVTVVLCWANRAIAQESAEAGPQSFLNYLKPEMHIGIESVEGTSDVLINVYTNQNFETAAMLAGLRSVRRASEVAETNKVIREALTAYIERRQLPESDAESILLMPLLATSLATVRVIGNDYVLVELNDGTKRRKLIPKARIGAINLDATPIGFLERPTRAPERDGG